MNELTKLKIEPTLERSWTIKYKVLPVDPDGKPIEALECELEVELMNIRSVGYHAALFRRV